MLRFNCHSKKSKQENSGQRIIKTENININLKIKSCSFDDKNIYINWNDNSNDIETSIIPIEFLLKNNPENFKQDEKKFQTSNASFFSSFYRKLIASFQ